MIKKTVYGGGGGDNHEISSLGDAFVNVRPLFSLCAPNARVSWSFLKASARPQNHRANIVIIIIIIM